MGKKLLKTFTTKSGKKVRFYVNSKPKKSLKSLIRQNPAIGIRALATKQIAHEVNKQGKKFNLVRYTPSITKRYNLLKHKKHLL
jgi:hypothetical protein